MSNHGDKISIANGEYQRCGECESVYAIKNSSEVLFRNISMLYMKEDKIQVKYKKCKNLIDMI